MYDAYFESMSIPGPREFGNAWVAAWNARDVEAVLAWFAEDVAFTSPTAAKFVPDSGGTIHGKDALRRYWTMALDGNPDLRFELLGVYAGVDTLVLNYSNQLDLKMTEVLTFDHELVVSGHATHLATG